MAVRRDGRDHRACRSCSAPSWARRPTRRRPPTCRGRSGTSSSSSSCCASSSRRSSSPLATIGVPTICMILLFLLPFIDRGPERRPERRPIATLAGIFAIAAMALPDLPRRGRRLAERDRHEGRRQQYEAGKLVAAQSGCLACHKIGENGNDGPGPHLTEIGDKLPQAAIRAHAGEPDGADAVVRGPARGEEGRRSSTSSRSSRARPSRLARA